MDGSPPPDQFWAKLRYKNDDPSTGEIVAWHPLLAHSADVAAVTEALLQRTILRARLASLIGSVEEAEAEDYPLVTHVDASRTDPTSIHAASSDTSKTVEPQLRADADDLQAVARRALNHARNGARVLVIRNLSRQPSGCIAMQRAVEDLAADDELLFGVDGTPPLPLCPGRPAAARRRH